MLSCGVDYIPEKYKDYRNRTVTKHLDKIRDALRQISDCSLKPEDKENLKKKMIEQIQTSL
jgi:hypothetical protein